MTREIKFRGKRINNGEWVYGYFLVNKFSEHTICGNDFAYQVKPETIGQFTGLFDKNKKEIYEGDILKYSYPSGYSLCKVEFGIYDNGEEYEDKKEGNGWYVEEYSFYNFNVNDKIDIYPLNPGVYPFDNYEYEIIGNIYENPDLLEIK